VDRKDKRHRFRKIVKNPPARTDRLDHGALAALLAPTPTPLVVAAIRTIFEAPNPVEDGPGGLYEQCENLAGAEAEQIFA